MKTRIIVFVSLLVSLLAFNAANATTVTVNGNTYIGIQGLEILGELYDVYFDTAYTGADFGANFANQAVTAINSEFNSQNPTLHYVQGGGATNDAYLIQYVPGNSGNISYAAGAYMSNGSQKWRPASYAPSDFSDQDPAVFANFSLSAVPIPGAFILFGSALVLVGVIKRRLNQ